MLKPDYDNSILSLAASVLKHYGVADCPHQSQPLFDQALAGQPSNVVIMLFDGMGISLIEKHLPADSFLRRHLAETISSVFPPTTVAATTSIQSGQSPAEHGWLGWTLYFKEADDNVNVFANTSAETGRKVSPANLAKTYMPYNDIMQRISEADSSVRTCWISPFTPAHSYSAASACRKTLKASRQPGRKYIYSYWPFPDHLIHKYGVSSRPVHRNIVQINRQVEKMAGQMKDAVIVITADHGLIDTEWLYLSDQPQLCEMLVRRPSIETRALSLFVKEGCQNRFEKEFRQVYGNWFELISKKDVLSQNLFGSGPLNPRITEFLGDYLAVATGRYSLAYQPARHPMIGIHAGATLEEYEVPLILISKPKE